MINLITPENPEAIMEGERYMIMYVNMVSNYTYTRTSGAYGPLVLAPMEGMGALQAPYFCLFCIFCLFALLSFCLFALLSFCLFAFLSFCLFVTTIIIKGSISSTTPNFVLIQQFFNITTHLQKKCYHKPLPL